MRQNEFAVRVPPRELRWEAYSAPKSP